jgi:hypothetical protein
MGNWLPGKWVIGYRVTGVQPLSSGIFQVPGLYSGSGYSLEWLVDTILGQSIMPCTNVNGLRPQRRGFLKVPVIAD